MTDSCIPGLAEYDPLVDEEAGNLLRKIQERRRASKNSLAKPTFARSTRK
jgi:hypothetical protein